MKLAQLQEAKYKENNVLQQYEDAYDPIENEPTQITPTVLFKFYDLAVLEGGLAGVFYFQVSAATAGEICRKVKCPRCAARVNQPCKRMRGQYHRDRYNEADELLGDDEILANLDIQHARGFVKHLLKKYNLPYTEIRIGVSFTKSIYFAVSHPNLKEKPHKWDGDELREARLTTHPVIEMVNDLIKLLTPNKTVASDKFKLKYLDEAVDALTIEFGQPELYGLTDDIKSDKMWEWHHNQYSILLEAYGFHKNVITLSVWISDTQHQDIARGIE